MYVGINLLPVGIRYITQVRFMSFPATFGTFSGGT